MTRASLANVLRLGFFGLVVFGISMYSLSLHRFAQLEQPYTPTSLLVSKKEFLARDDERNLSADVKEKFFLYLSDKKPKTATTVEEESRQQKRHQLEPWKHYAHPNSGIETESAAQSSDKTGQVSNRRTIEEGKAIEKKDVKAEATPTLPKANVKVLQELKAERSTRWAYTREAHENRLAPANKRQKKELIREGNKKKVNALRGSLFPSTRKKKVARRAAAAATTTKDNTAAQDVMPTGTRPSNAIVPAHKVQRRNKPAGQIQRDSSQKGRPIRNVPEPPPPSLRHLVHDPLMKTPKKGAVKLLPFSPEVPYLGVLVDAGRHYFPIAWLKRLIRYLYYMRYNLIHFRLTDDQAFNVRLDSHPEFAKPSAVTSNGTVYSTSELRDLVVYAKKYNITIMPEINVPGHAGAWHGIPGMLVPCPNFICTKGYGIPLNIHHPKVMDIIKDTIMEVSEIFHTSPFFHLGGDEVHLAAPCFEEAGLDMFDYESFETKLGDIVSQVLGEGIGVVRWEMTGKGQHINVRTVSIEHYWRSRNYARDPNGTAFPFFASHGLYFDSNKQADAFEIYEKTRAYVTSPERPTAIVAGTFELGMDTWLDRNIMGRLLAVAMGASTMDFTAKKAEESTSGRPSFYQSYFDHCKSLAFGEGVCSLYGKPAVSEQKYKQTWDGHWGKWKGDICERLTISRTSRVLSSSWNARYQRTAKEAASIASSEFWDKIMVPPSSTFAEEHFDPSQLKARNLPVSLRDSIVPYRGVILDLVRGMPGHNVTERLEHIVDIMAELGFNLLQLRIMDDLEFLLSVDSRLNLKRVNEKRPNFDEIIPQIVEYSYHRGIMIMPEMSVATRSGGWSHSVPHVPCPNVICNTGRGLAIDMSQVSVLPILVMTLRNIRNMFSSKFIHLGFDEREESMTCFDEAGMSPNFDSIEKRMEEILRIEQIPLDHVIRWENREKRNYTVRAGGVTHYRLSNGPTNSSSPWFASTNLAFDNPKSSKLDAWDIYTQTHSLALKSPTGILASVGVIDAKSWTTLNIKGRLLAVAMGLAGHASSPDTFRKTYGSTCRMLTGYHCDIFGAVNVTESWWKARQEASERRMNTTCVMRTAEITKRTARVGTLVE